MPMIVEGLACFGAFGSGPDALREAFVREGAAGMAVAAGGVPDATTRHAVCSAAAGASGPSGDSVLSGGPALAGGPVLFRPQVDTAALANYFPPRALRQMDRFSRMALLGSCMALEDAGLPVAAPERCGVVLASGYGPATPTFEFLDSVLDFGEGMASPLAFSHSVTNIPAAVIARTLGVAGPCATICQFEGAVAAGLSLARTWLEEGRVDRVLFGALDETTPLLACTAERLDTEQKASVSGAAQLFGLHAEDAASGKKEAAENAPNVADGAVFFLLSRGERGGRGVVESVEFTADSGGMVASSLPAGRSGEETFVFFSGSRALSGNSGAWPGRAMPGGRRVYGDIPVALAFDCAAVLGLLAATGGRALCVEAGCDAASRVTLAGAGV